MITTDSTRAMLRDIVARLSAEYRPKRVILFGSYAYGQPRPDSDIDLLIVKDTSDRFIDRWVDVRRILSDPKRTIPLETIVLTPQEITNRLNAGDQFLAEILKKGEILYDA